MKKEDIVKMKKLTADGRVVPIDYLTLEEILGNDWRNNFHIIDWKKYTRAIK
jgi:hypothetical protein